MQVQLLSPRQKNIYEVVVPPVGEDAGRTCRERRGKLFS